MVELTSARLDAVFHALADPTRREMLASLAVEPKNVTALAAPYRMSLAAASKHVKALERAGLVRRQVRGRTHLCQLDTAPLKDADAWLSFYRAFWTGQFDRLDQILNAETAADCSEEAP